MDNNDIIRKLRYIFDLSDDQMINIFKSGNLAVTRSEISNWLKKEDHEDFSKLRDIQFSAFLNGLVVLKRGKREGPPVKNEKSLNNNLILRKIKIALNLKDVDMVNIFDKADFEVSKHEINALFRKPDQKQYRECKDQFLRNFLMGLQLHLR